VKRIAIVQSCYVPWRGYFDLARRVDEFVLYDDARYTRSDWRNRNRIKTAAGTKWLSIPVRVPAGGACVRDVETDGDQWRRRHWRTLEHAYGRAPWFEHYRPRLEPLYLGERERRLSVVNRRFLETLAELLGIATPWRWSWELELLAGRNERLIGICRQLGADEYLSGPAARDYLDEAAFARAGIRVVWMSYDGYRDYPQLHGDFEPAVSALDLLFQLGPRAPELLLPLDLATPERTETARA
jgi:hypothetical protein